MGLKKRLTAVAAVAAAAAVVLYGNVLESGGSEEGKSLLPWAEEKETIYFWYTDDMLSNYLNSAAVAFGEKEGVRVIPYLASDSEYLEAINQASLHSAQVPDAYIVSHDSLEKAYLAGLAVQIEDGGEICNEDQFPAAALSAVTYQDKFVGYPCFFETSALVYNETYLAEWAAQIAMKDLLSAGEVGDDPAGNADGIQIDETQLAALTEEYFSSAIPDTVDDILYIANTFDVPMEVEGVCKWDVTDIFYNYWFVGNYMIVGGDAGDNPRNIDIDNLETIQCLEVYKALNQFFFIESDTVDYDTVATDFCEGRLIFTIATTDMVKRLKDAKEEGSIDFQYGIAPLPQVGEELQSRAMSVTNAVAINGYSQHKELANHFAAYLVGECAYSLYERTGRVSANLNTNVDDESLQVFKQQYADSVPLPKMMETGNFWLQLEGLFSKVWNGADVTELVRELAEQIAIQVGSR